MPKKTDKKQPSMGLRKKKPKVKKTDVVDDIIQMSESELLLNISGANEEKDNSNNNESTEFENIDEIEDDDDFNDNVEVDDEDHQLSDSDVNILSETEAEDNCLYEDPLSDDESPEADSDVDVNDDTLNFDGYVAVEDRKTKPVLFHFEYVRLLEDRVEQILRGAKKMIQDGEHLEPIHVAKLEIKHNVIPMKIIRTLPNNQKELWSIKELEHAGYDKKIDKELSSA